MIRPVHIKGTLLEHSTPNTLANNKFKSIKILMTLILL